MNIKSPVPIDEQCARSGCGRRARGDDFCSRYCCEVHIGRVEPLGDKELQKQRQRRRYWKKKIGGAVVSAEVTDALNRRLPGSYGTGKRQ